MENNATWNDNILLILQKPYGKYISISVSKRKILENIAKSDLTPLHILVLDNLSKAHSLSYSTNFLIFEISFTNSNLILKLPAPWDEVKQVFFGCTGLTYEDFELKF